VEARGFGGKRSAGVGGGIRGKGELLRGYRARLNVSLARSFFWSAMGRAQGAGLLGRQTVGVADPYESSGLHSLASLREHEKTRAQQRVELARARAEAEQRAREEAERLEHARRLAERAARESAESAQRAELFQLEQARSAEFERAESMVRTSSELRSQLESERVARRRVELSLTSQLLRQRLWTQVSATLGVAGGLAAVGVYFGALRPNAERARATSEQSLLSERRARTEAQQGEVRSKLRAEELNSRLRSLEQTLQSEREHPAQQPSAPPSLHRPLVRESPPGAPANVKPCRDDGDPLNPCLKR